jgi:cytochrome b pre-mRNA-processing protein 3
MKLFDRLFGPGRDDREAVRPLWHALVAAARRPRWFTEFGVADNVEGRFDMVSVILATVMLRLEPEPAFRGHVARLTELFVDDMDGQLRQAGVGDLVVGKHMGRLMSVLGGRLGALRAALALGDDEALAEVVRRNMTMADDARAGALAGELRAFSHGLEALDAERVVSGELP